MYAGLRISNTLHKKSRCIGPGLCRTSEKFGNANFGEFPFRNCLEIRNGSRIGATKRPRGVKEVPIGCLLAPKKSARDTFCYFPNSFSRHFVNKGNRKGRGISPRPAPTRGFQTQAVAEALPLADRASSISVFRIARTIIGAFGIVRP